MNYEWTKYHERRELYNLARDRLHLLTGRDKVLLSMYLDGQSIRQLSRLIGIAPATMRKRLQKHINALTGPACSDYLLAIRNRDIFTPAELSIARDHLLSGMSVRKIAAKRKTTYYRSYRTLRKILRNIEQCREQSQSQSKSLHRHSA